MYELAQSRFHFIGHRLILRDKCIAIIGYSRRRGSYTQLLMHGVAVFIAVQAFVNITGVIRLLPLTGVPLPLVSYGGSAMVVVFFGLGLVYGGHTSDI